MLNTTVLFITNDQESFQMWEHIFQNKGIHLVAAVTTIDAVQQCELQPFDLILIDAEAESSGAIEICRALRAQLVNPILLLMDQGWESCLFAAYEAGADECIVKPVSIRLLLYKVNAWLRRSWNMPTEILDTLCAGPFCLDSSKRVLLIDDGRTIKLTGLEFRLLHLLMSHPNRTMDGNLIVNRVWGHSGEGDNTVLKNVVYRLRRKIEPNPSSPRYLQNSPGEGYVFHP